MRICLLTCWPLTQFCIHMSSWVCLCHMEQLIMERSGLLFLLSLLIASLLLSIVPLLSVSDVSPRRRMLNVSRSVWKQANVASDLWEKLTARCVDRHRHMERTLERLLQIQAAMEELAMALEQAEGVRDAWEPVGDLFIDSLQDHIDATKVIRLRWLDHKWLMQTNRCLHFSDWILKGMVSDLVTTYISYYFNQNQNELYWPGMFTHTRNLL